VTAGRVGQDAGVRIGLHVPNFGAFGSAQALAEVTVAAEAAGWDGVFVWDHVVRREADLDVVDPWVAMAAMAVASRRVTFGPLVTPLPRRRPWNVAKAAVALDHLSGGRFVLGVGTGTPRGPEFPAFGEETDARRRGDMLDEGLAIVTGAWSGEPVHHDGAHYQVDGIRFLPTPTRPDAIPLWAAVESVRGRAVRRAATLDGVVPIGIGPAELPALVAAIDAARADRPTVPGNGTGAGRDAAGPYEIVTLSRDDDTDGPGPWRGSALTWWLRTLPWAAPLGTSLEFVAAGPPA
jgi:alkanesulfonate monooxygenase SsuD/methylene tetrahydromethanopterin reductase-like flavin-dependent oxidoreductase (luciferase family)